MKPKKSEGPFKLKGGRLNLSIDPDLYQEMRERYNTYAQGQGRLAATFPAWVRTMIQIGMAGAPKRRKTA